MGGTGRFAVSRSWASWGLWTVGVLLRWTTNLREWHWRWMLPLSALLELAGFLSFLMTVRRHRATKAPIAGGVQESRTWMGAVIAGTLGFLMGLVGNLAVVLQAAVHGIGPAIPHAENQRLLALFTWAFPVVTIWGFSARWLPVFLGLQNPGSRLLVAALLVNLVAVAAALAGLWVPATVLFLTGTALSAVALRVFAPAFDPRRSREYIPPSPDLCVRHISGCWRRRCCRWWQPAGTGPAACGELQGMLSRWASSPQWCLP